MIGYKVRLRRERLGLFQEQLAKLAGISKNTVTKIEKERDVRTSKLNLVLAALVKAETGRGLPVGDATIFGTGSAEPEGDRIENDVSDYTPNDIPVIYEGEASPQGTLFWDDEGKLKSDVERRISRPRDVTDPRAYGVIVRGDSMIPKYFPSQTLIVSPNASVRSGAFAFVELLSGERLIKRVHRQPGGWNLESLNAAYAPRFVKQDEIGSMHKIVYSKEL